MPYEPDEPAVVIQANGLLRTTAEFVRIDRKGRRFTVAQGYVTDLASVPRLLRWLLAISGSISRDAIFHDLCCDDLNTRYRQGRTRDSRRIDGPLLNAVETDRAFREALAESGQPVLMRWIYWDGVRLGALRNPARRDGWGSTAVPVLLLTLALLPLLAVPTVVVGVFFALYVIVEAVVTGMTRLFPVPGGVGDGRGHRRRET